MNLIAVVTINRNNNQEVLRLFEELKNQSYKNWMFIVIDDNSSDSSILENINDYRFKLFKYPSPFQFAYAKKFNFAYRKAIPYNPKYILKLHTDMIIKSVDLISLMSDCMENNDNVVSVGPQIFNRNNVKTWGYGIIKERCGHRYSVHECYMIRTSYLVDHKGFQDEIFTWYGEEMDYFSRIYRKGFKTDQVSGSIIHYGGATSAEFVVKKRYYRAKSTLMFLYKHNKNVSLIQNLKYYYWEKRPEFIAGFKLLKNLNFKLSFLNFYYLIAGFLSALSLILIGKIKRI